MGVDRVVTHCREEWQPCIGSGWLLRAKHEAGECFAKDKSCSRPSTKKRDGVVAKKTNMSRPASENTTTNSPGPHFG